MAVTLPSRVSLDREKDIYFVQHYYEELNVGFELMSGKYNTMQTEMLNKANAT